MVRDVRLLMSLATLVVVNSLLKVSNSGYLHKNAVILKPDAVDPAETTHIKNKKQQKELQPNFPISSTMVPTANLWAIKGIQYR